ncbi:MAG: hypothetical protein ACT4OE_01065 [Sphingosinicella sp.]
MNEFADKPGIRRGFPWRILGWGAAAGLILLPLVAMQFTGEVNWTVGDFLVAILLIGGVGLAFELAVRVTPNNWYRGGVAAALAGALLLIWANGAVGMIGSEENAYNLWFGSVLFVALIGVVIARFEPSGMARAMVAAAIMQGTVAAFGLPLDLRGGMLSMAFAGLWLLAAALFWKAAHKRTPA